MGGCHCRSENLCAAISLQYYNIKNESSMLVINDKQLAKVQALFRKYNYRSIVFPKQFSFFPTRNNFTSSHPGAILHNLNNVYISPPVLEREEELGKLKFTELEASLAYSLKHRKYMIQYKDYSVYYGYYNLNWEKEGLGELFFADGSKYVGQFKENLKEGKGRLISKDGDYYEGLLVT